ncbi:MAG TPA: SDR family oxidoreductase [Thermoanaerobaculia bacterium]
MIRPGEGAGSAMAGTVAAVTGGGGGIGRAVAVALATHGAAVVIVGRTAEHLRETEEAVRSATPGARAEVTSLRLDVRREDDMEEMARAVLERHGRIDVLVHAAGILRASQAGLRPVAETAVEEWREVLRTNLRGTFLADRAVLPAMIGQRSGDIVNLSSTSALKGLPYAAAYCASKFAILGLTESLHEEVRRFGVRVQALLPGPVATAIWEQNRPVPPPERCLPVERVAAAVLHLLALPRDVCLVHPALVPFRPHRRPAWRAAGPGVASMRLEEVGR